MLDGILRSIDARREQSLLGLKEFLKIPSVSTDPKSKPAVEQCARWLADQLKSIGLKTQIIPTGAGRGQPVVLAKNEHVTGRPTVLFYGHYDVQPPEPLDLWTTGAFEPTVRNGAIYARGASDDKGQSWAHIEAVRAWQQAGGLPINLTMLIEGEEEIGSINLPDFVSANRVALDADIAVVSDTNQFARGIPAIGYGLRGLVYMEVSITGTKMDLHSGLYGGAVPNAINVLTELLATLHDRDGRVMIRGFYDSVVPLATDEREMWAALPFDEKKFTADVSPAGLTGEKGYSPLEQTWARPTCDINGISGGYEGPGAKTIIPSRATAKVSMRLVPNQDPVKIRDAFTEALRQRCPKYVKLDVHCHSYTPPVLVPMHGPAMELASEAVEIGFGARPTLIRGGGSVPILDLLKTQLGVETLLIGFGLPDDNVHSPNEKFDLDALHNGTRTVAVLYERLARLEGVH
jgi:acetylornithine deacetylase/succinyl-diaminopimelate desuccinylase-like protein